MESYDEVVILVSEEEIARRIQSTLLKEQVPVFIYEDRRVHRDRDWTALAVPPEFFGHARFYIVNSVEGGSLRQDGDLLVLVIGEVEEVDEVDEVEEQEEQRPNLVAEVEALVERGDEAIPDLVDLILTGDEELATEASTVLLRFKEKASLELSRRFETAFADRNLRDLGLLLCALRSVGQVPALFTGFFSHGDSTLRVFAFQMATSLGLGEGKEHLLAGLRDEDLRVREEAADLLYELSGSDMGYDPSADSDRSERLIRRVVKWLAQ